MLDVATSLGPAYYELRSNLRKTPLQDHNEAVRTWLDTSGDCPLNTDRVLQLLAIFTWLNDNRNGSSIYKTYFHTAPQELRDAFDRMCQVVEVLWPVMMRSSKGSEQYLFQMKQLVLLICSVIHLETPLMSNLKLLMSNPLQLQDKFWPAMPESFYFSIPLSLRSEGGMDAMYQCPNGHFYTIGQCTRPWMVSKCPDCGAAIGGVHHNAAAGNQRVEKMDENSQAGYMINKDQKNLQQPQDRISLQASSVIQLLIHVCMLHGFQQDPASAIRYVTE